MVIEKVILKVGKKKIELTQSEYEELKQHFTDKEYIPYPYPIYPQPINPTWPTYPIITYGKQGSTVSEVYFNDSTAIC